MTMIIDNFDNIQQILKFNNDAGDPIVYQIDLIERKKDGVKTSGCQNSARRITSFYPESWEQWEKYKHRIKDLCDARPGLRAYINPNPKRASSIMKQMLTDLSDRFQHNAYTGLNKFFPSAIAKTKPAKSDSIWILDIDNGDPCLEKYKDTVDFLLAFGEQFPGAGIIWNPSKNGFHLLTHPFDRQKFNEWIGQKEDGYIKINALTNLYMNTGNIQ